MVGNKIVIGLSILALILFSGCLNIKGQNTTVDEMRVTSCDNIDSFYDRCVTAGYYTNFGCYTKEIELEERLNCNEDRQ